MSPIISQWPVVVSLPALTSFIRPNADCGASLEPGCGSVCSRPSRVSVGRLGCSAARTWPSVFEPSSPKSFASGSSPTPRESQTITIAHGFAIGASLSRGLDAVHSALCTVHCREPASVQMLVNQRPLLRRGVAELDERQEPRGQIAGIVVRLAELNARDRVAGLHLVARLAAEHPPGRVVDYVVGLLA